MPLETATYISDLVPSNPASSDPLAQADDHMRLIKGVLKAQFPNFTSAALASTNAQLDAAGTAATTGASKLADAGAFFNTNTTDGLLNPAAGQINLQLAGTLAASFLNSSGILSMSLPGTLNVTGAITGPGVVPIGGMIMWLTDTLPAVGTWCWANGGTLSRTGNGAALYAAWSLGGGNPLLYGAGDGVTTFNVINMQEVVPVGKSTMGGAASPGLINSIASGLKGVLNGLFGSDTAALTAANIPTITGLNTNTVSLYVTNANTVGIRNGQSSNGNGVGVNQYTDAVGIASTGTIAPYTIATVSTNTGGSAPVHANTQPSRVVNFIIRIG